MTYETALLTAVGALTSALVGLFWLYVRARDSAEARYQIFTEKMLPILEEFKVNAVDFKNLVREWLRGRSGPP